jgi:hypothetical protein
VAGLQELITRVSTSVTRVAERRRVLFVSASVLLMGLALLTVSFATADRGQTIFGPALGADYAEFYSAGTLLNTAPPARLYDFALQDAIHHAVLPNDRGHLPFCYPPFVALVFRPLARLPYAWSFGVWLLLSGGLYLAGLVLTLRTLRFLPGADRRAAFWLALSFEPFLMECWMGGQLSALGFFCLALAYYWLETCRPTAAGVALGFCLYKPTLLVLLLPLLVLARHWRVLAGFTLAGVGLAGASLAVAGRQGCLDYTRVLLAFTRTTSSTEGAVFLAWKYVDLNSFFRLLLGGPSPVAWALMLLILPVPLGALVVAWWRVGRSSSAYRRVVWASTLTWTLVANLYVPVYDSVLVVLAVLLTADVLSQPGNGSEPIRSPTFPVFLLLLYLGPWVSQHVARVTGLQPYSLILLAFAVYQLRVARTVDAATGRGDNCPDLKGPSRRFRATSHDR